MFGYIFFIHLFFLHLARGNADCPGNNKYNLQQRQDRSACMVWGNYHVKTFDDHAFSFNSECTFKLVSFKAQKSDFSVEVGRWNNVCPIKNKCTLSIEIVFDGVKYKAGIDDKSSVMFTIDGKEQKLPLEKNGLRVHQPSRRIKIEFTEIGVTINWDKEDIVEVIVDTDKGYRVSGLCGNMDKCSTNDQMLVNGIVTDDLIDFIKEWQTDKASCPTVIDTKWPCVQKFKEDQARAACDTLKNHKFAEAQKVLNPDIFYRACLWDHCRCREDKTEVCLCDTYDVYAKASLIAGAKPSFWRDDNLCPIECPKGPKTPVYLPCAPPGGVKTCGDDQQEANKNKGECEEGCYCQPPNYIFQGKCYVKRSCPCLYNGRVIQPGGTVQQDCHTCTCTDGKIDCPKTTCHVTGVISGDPHYTTWDGKKFDFMGKCYYYVMKGRDFSVEASHEVYHNGKFIKSNKQLPSYMRRIIIKMAGEVVDLKPGPEVVVNGVPLKRFPHTAGAIFITKPAHNKIKVDLPNEVQVHWDGYSTGTFKLPTPMEGEVSGLLGTYNGDASDDFMTPTGEIVSDPITFGNSWKTDDSCLDEPQTPLKHPCEVNPGARPAAERICATIKGDVFKQCGIQDPETSYENCVYDTCFCRDDPDKCSCDQIAVVAGECGAKAMVVNWRDRIPECRLPCPAGQVYQECGDGCARTCEDLAIRPNCMKECVEGCNCAPGRAMDEDGKCVPIAQCKCRIGDIVYQPGFQYLDKKTMELHTCKEARWVQSPATDEEQKTISTLDKLNQKCDPEHFSVYTPCRYPTPKTCYNMHAFEIISIENCDEGCECKEGFALDPRTNNCVRTTDCPCHYKGRSYETDAVTVQDNCNRCTCSADGTWKCKKEDCDKLCVEIEVKQEDCNTCTCTDAFWKCTQRDCSQKCEVEGANKKIDCNTCECTDGFWSCTKKQCGQECKENEVKQDGCKTCACVDGLWECKEDGCVVSTCENEGAVKLVDYGKCVCIGGIWKCTKGQCDAWGDSHIKTFDGKRFDFQGQCSYTLSEGKLDHYRFSVTFTTELCSHTGATCLQSATIRVEANGVEESLSLIKDVKPDASNLKRMKLTDHFLFITVDLLDAGVHVFWDKKTWVYVKLDEKWQKKVEGLCGNYNRFKDDDTEIFDVRSDDKGVLAFVDKWRTKECEKTVAYTNTCDKDRREWATESCRVLLGPVFSPCHASVPADSYHEACVTDSCKCDLGGDCECLCTAISAYAQQCNNYGVPIAWRSQQLCPIQCAKSTQYQPCVKTCPQKTCETILKNETIICDPEQLFCTEGCAPIRLPAGYVYTDSNYDRNVKEENCLSSKCGDFYEGEVIIREECRLCVCTGGRQRCVPLPCSDSLKTTEPTATETAVVTEAPTSSTTTTDVPMNTNPECDDSKCASLNCPKDTIELQIPGECCKSCQHETKCVARLQYSKRYVLKNLGEEWVDGPCRECTCVPGEDFNHCIRCRDKVCTQVESSNVTRGNTYYEYSSGPCCKKMEQVACVHGDSTYNIGETWEIDRCTSMKCDRDFTNNNLTVLLELTQICNEHCPNGFVYKKSENGCCGECVREHCTVDHLIKKVGEKWYSEDGCTAYVCSMVNQQYKVLSQRTICPPVEKCSGKIRKGSCCYYCDTNELYTWKAASSNCNSDTIPSAV